MAYNRQFDFQQQGRVPVQVQYPQQVQQVSVPTTGGPVPQKKEDRTTVETRIDFIVAKKDGKLWVKHQTIITDFKPFSYYQTAVAAKQAKALVNQQQQQYPRRS